MENVEEANRLNQKIRFTDALIDLSVYRLYDLMEEEIEIVEKSI